MNAWLHAGSVEKLKEEKATVIKSGIAVFCQEDQVYAVDNRCPHMGFPLHMGSLCEGILTCHWHHARFDVSSGGTLDPWADDVRTYEVKIEAGEVWINPASRPSDQREEHMSDLQKGLAQNLELVIAKAVVGLIKAKVPNADIVRAGIMFGTSHRSRGWGPGLTILAAMANILPKLDEEGQIQALYQGLSHVAHDCAGEPPQHLIGPLTGFEGKVERLRSWYRQCIEVRDRQGAERVLQTAIEKELRGNVLSDMMITAATDHFYIDEGHTLDFHNKAFEVLDHIGEEGTIQVLSSLPPLFTTAARSEEQQHWQAPINLVKPLHEAFEKLKVMPEKGSSPFDEAEFLDILLSERPLTMIDHLTQLLMSGADPVRVGQVLALAGAERIVRFNSQNEFSDWITVLHTFSHAHAVHERLRHSSEKAVYRALYHGAVSIYLNHFLNVPAVRRPSPTDTPSETMKASGLLELLNKQQQVNQAGKWVVQYIEQNGDEAELFNTLGHALLREDANFHTYQMYEAASTEYDRWADEDSPFAKKAKETLLIALARYLAAHAPTARKMPHTGKIAHRLYRGEKLFEG
ncbi:Rieske (2Fe-2S) protein [Salsuginibacillus kocurii]|uniref:Rieske (2Fe-2S) protein n=1 Tax=Salsuginibacillus kocurii TaxID=427078 RepID=UPI0003644364|nr:Rieske (2Fe-2S) protein [Salsuginibacillus kocurii]